MLTDELARFERATSTSDALAQLRVTHCPVCDQEITSTQDGHTCFLCRRPYRGSEPAGGKQRVSFEKTQLKEEQGEITALISTLDKNAAELRKRMAELQQAQAQTEIELRPARQFALTLLPPDLAILNQSQGRLNEQLDTLTRVRKSLESQHKLTKEIENLAEQEQQLKAELDATKSNSDLEKVSLIFEERLNDYLNAINASDASRWKHGRVSFRLKERSFFFKTDEKLGATSQALFLFAYHYALLSLSADSPFCYPGLVIVDFPLNLADGATIRDKENYLVEPFVKLCAQPTMKDTQFIAAGHAFENLEGAHHLAIRRPILAG